MGPNKLVRNTGQFGDDIISLGEPRIIKEQQLEIFLIISYR